MNTRIGVILRLAVILATIITPATVLTIITVPAYAAEIAADVTVDSSSKTTDAFSPNPIEANVGDTVTWTNRDSVPHTVTSGVSPQPDGRFNSSPNFNPLLNPGATFSHTFTEAGEYPYFCAVHPNAVGTVIVTAGGNQTAGGG